MKTHRVDYYFSMAKDTKSKQKPGKGAVVADFPAAARGKICISCGAPMEIAYRPFCSKRCADLDLGRWFREDYRIPAEEPPEGDEQGFGNDPDADTN